MYRTNHHPLVRLARIELKSAGTFERSAAITSNTGRLSLFFSHKMGQLLSTTLTALGYCQPKCQNEVLYFRKISDQATTPSRGTDLAAGYDLSSAQNVIIPKQGKALVMTDIAIALPEGCYGRVAPRSSLSWKHHIDVGAGVIDRDYRGNIGVVLFNLSQSDYEVHHGDRIAQLIIERISTPPLVELEVLDDTARGTAGYGSTGK